MKNRVLARAAAACLACLMAVGTACALPQTSPVRTSLCASAAEGQPYTEVTAGALTCHKYNDYALIAACDPEAETVEIPAEIGGVPVREIGADAFWGCAVSKVTIPDSVISIGARAFFGCSDLTEAEIPESVFLLDAQAFADCASLEKVTLSEGLKTIGTEAFAGTALQEVAIPASVTHFGQGIFDGTPWWEALVAEDPLVIFNNIVLDGRSCEGDVVIPDGVTEIGTYAFECSGITSVVIPDSVETIGMDAFSYCESLTAATIPDHIVELPIGMFCGCISLTSVKLPADVLNLRSSVFSGCTSLEEVIFPDHQVDVYSSVFSGTPWLEAKRAEDPLVIVNGTLIDGRTCKGDVVIPDDVTIIASRAFYSDPDITSVVVPVGVENIWDSTFESCGKLKSVELRGVSYIARNAFNECTSLKKVMLSGNLSTVSEDAFHGITGRIPLTYGGTKEQWGKVSVASGNSLLRLAIVTYGETGDVDGDAKLGVTDVAALQKWLLAVPDARIIAWNNADLNADGVLDTFDLALMKRELLAKE